MKTCLFTHTKQAKSVYEDGKSRRVNPDITLNLYVLFVAKFKDYEQSLHTISQILRYFQANPYFDLQNAPDLGKTINHLTLELDPLSTTKQNELWGILRSSYIPSIVYKVKAVTFIDDGQIPVNDSIITQLVEFLTENESDKNLL